MHDQDSFILWDLWGIVGPWATCSEHPATYPGLEVCSNWCSALSAARRNAYRLRARLRCVWKEQDVLMI